MDKNTRALVKAWIGSGRDFGDFLRNVATASETVEIGNFVAGIRPRADVHASAREQNDELQPSGYYTLDTDNAMCTVPPDYAGTSRMPPGESFSVAAWKIDTIKLVREYSGGRHAPLAHQMRLAEAKNFVEGRSTFLTVDQATTFKNMFGRHLTYDA